MGLCRNIDFGVLTRGWSLEVASRAAPDAINGLGWKAIKGVSFKKRCLWTPSAMFRLIFCSDEAAEIVWPLFLGYLPYITIFKHSLGG
jgi:hypothetical protein